MGCRNPSKAISIDIYLLQMYIVYIDFKRYLQTKEDTVTISRIEFELDLNEQLPSDIVKSERFIAMTPQKNSKKPINSHHQKRSESLTAHLIIGNKKIHTCVYRRIVRKYVKGKEDGVHIGQLPFPGLSQNGIGSYHGVTSWFYPKQPD